MNTVHSVSEVQDSGDEPENMNDDTEELLRAGRTIPIFVDGEPYEAQRRFMTPNEIIRQFGQKDPATNYLVKIRRHGERSFEGLGDKAIALIAGAKFQIISTGPTPVSDQNHQFGVAAFTAGLEAMGFAPRLLSGKSDHVEFDYEVPTGKFVGKQIKLGFVVPSDFPVTSPSGPHVAPHVLPLKGSGAHPDGCIHASTYGEAWQYWSRPFNDWGTTRKTVETYMSHIWRLWKTQ